MSLAAFTPILVSGVDAKAFLNGQLSCDVNTLNRDQSRLACINSPQGRVQAVVDLIERDDGIVMLVISPMAERTIQRLRKYVLRSKVSIEDGSSRFNSDEFSFGGMSTRSSLLAFIRAGVSHVLPETHEAFVAQMLNLDALGAISFNKGCYTGQEIIARAHYRGAVKRRMFRFAASCAPPPPGTRLVTASSEHAGDVVYADASEQGCELLAVVALAQAGSQLALDISGLPQLTQLPLPYSFDRDTG
jgi:folate-binding protein YgfZ